MDNNLYFIIHGLNDIYLNYKVNLSIEVYGDYDLLLVLDVVVFIDLSNNKKVEIV